MSLLLFFGGSGGGGGGPPATPTFTFSTRVRDFGTATTASLSAPEGSLLMGAGAG